MFWQNTVFPRESGVFFRIFARCHTCEPPFLQEWRRCELQNDGICMYHIRVMVCVSMRLSVRARDEEMFSASENI